ncbi:hypothetical protein IT568_05445 [bacterium]|nr:hypothetical protein [bacterium]
MKKPLLIVCGEFSAQVYAEKIIEKLKQTDIFLVSFLPSQKVEKSRNFLIGELAEIGFTNLTTRFLKGFQFQREILELVKTNKIQTALLVDLPSFNLPLAKELKKLGLKVNYFVSPKFWAWNFSRVKELKLSTDVVFSIFPFEAELLQKNGVKSFYCGNVSRFLVSQIEAKQKTNELLLLAGSRQKEVENFFVNFDFAKTECVCSCLEFLVYPKNVQKSCKNSLELLAESKKAIATSGTVTLEAALSGVPTVVVYKLDFWAYFLAKRFIKVPFVSLPSIILGRKVFPELLQENFCTRNILVELKQLEKMDFTATKEELEKILGFQNPFEFVVENLVF